MDLKFAVLQILDTSKNENVDLLVAKDMLNGMENLDEAYKFINRNYDTVTKCRRLGISFEPLYSTDEETREKFKKEVADMNE